MKIWLSAATAIFAANGAAVAQPSGPVEAAKPPPLLLAQRRSTPDTSTPGSTAPGYPMNTRPNYVSRQEQFFAAELRKCETLGEAAQRIACKESVRERYGEM